LAAGNVISGTKGITMKIITHPPIEELSDPLRQIYHCVKNKPFHKLVSSGWLGSPGYAVNGTFLIADTSDKNVSVVLGVRWDAYYKKWSCYITITDGDDFIRHLWKDFTFENWNYLLKIYNDMYLVHPDLLEEFD
jgi:hypothetical protein